ncbi:archaetidylserine decarboxylase [Paenibacillus protaetiae]|uniref:Phosphatidylserine decarboxylase proenzyme n=1 Tax=Paenibacillus protaetiae TaxID=2509456 RepID=A0A4P6EUG8_9BACL|nr:archaetidylserine decarboxylase [Paenibacillus protaetiae]QAY66612.1 phosphatidylserine decarboxylase [Paenibacillus protaetiae]
MNRWIFRSMTELSSRKWISRLTGRFAQSKQSRAFLPRFVKIYGINVEEAEKPLEQYETLNEFFTRRLKDGARPVAGLPDAVASPVDALVTGIGPIHNGSLLNIKGQDYTIDELLKYSPRAENYRNGYYIVLYLSPTDYHRIHSPVDGRIVENERIPGKVYPVNDSGMRHMKQVLCRNERLITYIRHRSGELAVVKVGAMNVSSIKYAEPVREQVRKGDELAYFEFGSTVVLLAEQGTFTPRADLKHGTKVKMGELLGMLTAPSVSSLASAD